MAFNSVELSNRNWQVSRELLSACICLLTPVGSSVHGQLQVLIGFGQTSLCCKMGQVLLHDVAVKKYIFAFLHPASDMLSQNIKSNHFYCHITTAHVPRWVKFLRACTRQWNIFSYSNNLHIDSTYLQTNENVQNTHTYTQYTQCTIRHLYSYQYTLYTVCTHSTLCTHIYTQ